MDREDIIKLAREAGCKPFRSPEHWDDVQVFATPDVLERFAALVVEQERKRIIAANAPEIERCNSYIKALEDAVAAEREAICSLVYGMCGSDNDAERIVRAIRARGQE